MRESKALNVAPMSLVLRLVGAPAQALHKLEQMEWLNMLVELIGLLAFLCSSGRAARPLVGTAPTEQGQTFWRFMFGGGLAAPWIIQTILLLGHHSRKTASGQKQKGGVGLIVAALVLLGGYFLRRTMINAGHVSSQDTRTTLWNAR